LNFFNCNGYIISIQVELHPFIKLGRYKGSLIPISSDTFLGKYLNDDAYDLENRKIKFIKDQEKRITGFVMETEEIKNLKFKKIK
jgi:hypothetical protein